MYFAVTQSCCCEEDNETLYSCTSSGCVEDINGTLTAKQCASICTSWECTASGCKEREGDGFLYATEAECQDECKSWVCVSNGCLQWNNNAGTYSTFENCEEDSNCQSWKCVSDGCTSGLGNGGYPTKGECETFCTSYTCSGNLCQLISGNGGEFSSSQECQDAGCGSTSWVCTDNGCREISGSSGYDTEKECSAACCVVIMCYACLGGGICFETPVTSCNNQTCEDKGYYSDSSSCVEACREEGSGSGINPGE